MVEPKVMSRRSSIRICPGSNREILHEGVASDDPWEAAHRGAAEGRDQQHWSDYIINDSRGFLQTEFPAGGYTVMVGSSDSEAGSAVLEVSGG